MTTARDRRRAGPWRNLKHRDSSSAGQTGDPDEIVYVDSTRLGFIPIGVVLAVLIVLLLVAVGVPWRLAAVTVLPVTLTAAYLGMPRRSLRLGPNFLALREGRRPEVRLTLSEIEEVERIWVLRAGYHLELRAPSATIVILGLGAFSEPFLHEVGTRLVRVGSPQLRLGPEERRLLGIAE